MMKTQAFALDAIQRDTSRFQFRSAEFSEERVRWLVENWNENTADPLDVWSTPEGCFLLSGHHRLEAMLRLGIKEHQCRVHTFSLEEAQLFALTSNATRLSYTDFEYSKCVSFLVQSGCSMDEAANKMAISSGMARKYYGLRHLVGTDWEVHCSSLDLTTRAFELGNFCEAHPLKPSEIQSLFKITTSHDLNVSQFRQLLRDIRKRKDEIGTKNGSLFDVQEFATKTVKVVKERDFLNQCAAQSWWLYELVQKEEKHQFPPELKESFMRELKRFYSYCAGTEEEVAPTRANSKGRKLRGEVNGKESVHNNSRFLARKKAPSDCT